MHTVSVPSTARASSRSCLRVRLSRLLSRLAGVVLALAVLPALVTPPAAMAESRSPLASTVQPLERAYAHNDYEHERALLDALDHGFTSVEADVWLVDGELYIGHDAPDLGRTLTDTYLAPLAGRVRDNGGSAYPQWDGSIRLLIDVKSAGAAAYPVIEEKLAAFPWLMTTYRQGVVTERPVTAVISGNRDLAAMQAADIRRSFYDGRLGDLATGLPSTLVAMVSDNWARHFTWTGVGPMPAAERDKLHSIVTTAHAHGYDVRFWATPDAALPNREAIWRELVAAGVDALNTDDLPGLQSFLLAEDPAEQHAEQPAA